MHYTSVRVWVDTQFMYIICNKHALAWTSFGMRRQNNIQMYRKIENEI